MVPGDLEGIHDDNGDLVALVSAQLDYVLYGEVGIVALGLDNDET